MAIPKRNNSPETADIKANIETFNNTVKATPIQKKDDKSVLISLRVPEDVKNELKAYFAAHGMSLSNGLLTGAKYLMLEERSGFVTLEKGIAIKHR